MQSHSEFLSKMAATQIKKFLLKIDFVKAIFSAAMNVSTSANKKRDFWNNEFEISNCFSLNRASDFSEDHGKCVAVSRCPAIIMSLGDSKNMPPAF